MSKTASSSSYRIDQRTSLSRRIWLSRGGSRHGPGAGSRAGPGPRWLAALVGGLAAGALALLGPSQAHGGTARIHAVESGQTLWDIARSYGCKVDAIKKANKLERNLIRPGQKLGIPRCGGKRSGKVRSSGRVFLTHYVMEGESLSRIAKRYDTTIKDIKQRNRLKRNLIRPGQKLRVMVGKDGSGRAIPGQSVGESDNGKLVNGMQMPRGRGYYRRRPTRAWGANHTIYHTRRAIQVVRARFPKAHDLAIGDISSRKGGKLARHKSHQNGRDIDIGFYFTKRPKGYPKSFIRGTKSNLDMRANFALMKALIDTAGSPSGVEKIFLDYELQEIFYKWAKKRGVKQSTLDRMFQYPKGRGSTGALIRDEPGHHDHYHVRFKCPEGDKACKP